MALSCIRTRQLIYWKMYLYLNISQSIQNILRNHNFGGYQICFTWSVIMTISLRLQSRSTKCRMLLYNLCLPPSHISWCFVPSAHRQLYFCFRFCNLAGWCTTSAVGLWSEFVVSKYSIYFKLRVQTTFPYMYFHQFSEYVSQFLLFNSEVYWLEYFNLSQEKFLSNWPNELWFLPLNRNLEPMFTSHVSSHLT